MPHQISACTELDGALRQAEVLSRVKQFYSDAERGEISYDLQEYAIILTQDCDLEQDYARRKEGKPGHLNGILFFEAKTLGAMKGIGMDAGQYRKICQHDLERYHLVSEVPAELDLDGVGIPDLIIDFKRYFTISTSDFEQQLTSSDPPKRRTRLLSPYIEHLQGRMTSYMRRVALPEPPKTAVSFNDIKAIQLKP